MLPVIASSMITDQIQIHFHQKLRIFDLFLIKLRPKLTEWIPVPSAALNISGNQRYSQKLFYSHAVFIFQILMRSNPRIQAFQYPDACLFPADEQLRRLLCIHPDLWNHPFLFRVVESIARLFQDIPRFALFSDQLRQKNPLFLCRIFICFQYRNHQPVFRKAFLLQMLCQLQSSHMGFFGFFFQKPPDAAPKRLRLLAFENLQRLSAAFFVPHISLDLPVVLWKQFDPLHQRKRHVPGIFFLAAEAVQKDLFPNLTFRPAQKNPGCQMPSVCNHGQKLCRLIQICVLLQRPGQQAHPDRRIRPAHGYFIPRKNTRIQHQSFFRKLFQKFLKDPIRAHCLFPVQRQPLHGNHIRHLSLVIRGRIPVSAAAADPVFHDLMELIVHISHKIRQIAGKELQILRIRKENFLCRPHGKRPVLKRTKIIRCRHHLMLCPVLRQAKNHIRRFLYIIKSRRPQRTADPDGILPPELFFQKGRIPKTRAHKLQKLIRHPLHTFVIIDPNPCTDRPFHRRIANQSVIFDDLEQILKSLRPSCVHGLTDRLSGSLLKLCRQQKISQNLIQLPAFTHNNAPEQLMTDHLRIVVT